jgi:NAD(P)-dependent dehydrogenase (short-subunit alcohol dehydrogenase family)
MIHDVETMDRNPDVASLTSKSKQVDKHYPAVLEKIPDLKGMTVVVTGATSGTGLTYALAAGKKGATVVLLNRVSARADAAAKTLKAECPDGIFDTSIPCDLLSFASTRAAAAAVKAKYAEKGISVLCCNAGIMAFKDMSSEDGFDVQMQTNHLSHFLLCKELLPLLETAGAASGVKSRIVNHSSIARTGVKLDKRYFEKNGGNLGGDGDSMFLHGARWVRYGQTKMANAVYTHALQKRLGPASNTIAVCAAPGLANTELQITTAGEGGMSKAWCCCGGNMWIMNMAQSANDGACGILTASFLPTEPASFWEPAGSGMSGEAVPRAPHALETNAEAMAMLWSTSEAAIGETFLSTQVV